MKKTPEIIISLINDIIAPPCQHRQESEKRLQKGERESRACCAADSHIFIVKSEQL
jgi:hypothetical protein